jgi:hypothetical protein
LEAMLTQAAQFLQPRVKHVVFLACQLAGQVIRQLSAR